MDEDAGEKWDRLAVRVAAGPARRPRMGRDLMELIVLWHLANGHGDNEIAAHTGLGVIAVRTYVRGIRKKLGLVGRPRALLAATAIRHRLVP